MAVVTPATPCMFVVLFGIGKIEEYTRIVVRVYQFLLIAKTIFSQCFSDISHQFQALALEWTVSVDSYRYIKNDINIIPSIIVSPLSAYVYLRMCSYNRYYMHTTCVFHDCCVYLRVGSSGQLYRTGIVALARLE